MAEAHETESRNASATPQTYRANVVCQVIRDRDLKAAGRIALRWSEKGGFFPAYTIKASDLKDAVEKTRDAVWKVVDAHMEDGVETPELRAERLAPVCTDLAIAGCSLHSAIFSSDDDIADTVREWLDDLTARNVIETIEIFVEDSCDDAETGSLSAIPWNLVYGEEPRGKAKLTADFAASLAKPQDPELAHIWLPFWGVRYDIACVRNVDPLKRDSRIDPDDITVLMVLDDEVRQETESKLSQFAAGAEASASPGASATQATYERLKADLEKAGVKVLVAHDKDELRDCLIEHGQPDILYWLSHAEPEKLLLGGEELSIRDVREIFEVVRKKKKSAAKRGTIAFFNGCRTAIEAEQGSFLRSFTERDLFVGIVGTEHRTIDVYAYRFGLSFLQLFLTAHLPVGQLLRSLRRRTLPLGLLYGSYCPSRVRVAALADAAPPESTADLIVDTQMFGASLSTLSIGVSEAIRDRKSEPAEPPIVKPAAPPLPWPDKPYPSLGFYTLRDQALFLGRDDDSARLAELVDSPEVRVLLLNGTSGSGKSSVIRAGLVPWLEKYAVGYRFLRRPESEVTDAVEQLHLFFRPSNDFAGRLAADLLAFTHDDYPLAPRPDGTPQDPVPLRPVLAACVDPSRTDINQADLKAAFEDTERPDLLREILDALTAAIPEKLVVTIDQAEELYTLAQGDTPEEIRQSEARRDQAFALLRECLRGSGRWKVILSYRTEYHGRMTDGIRAGLKKTPGLVDYLITDLNKAQLRQVIERPTLDFPVVEGLETPRQKYGFEYEPGVIDEIVDGIFRLRGRNTDSVLPIAQVVCTRLYEQARANSGGKPVAVVSKRDLDRLRNAREIRGRAGLARIGGAASAGFEKLPAFPRSWLLTTQETPNSRQGKSADGDGPVLEILEDFANSTLQAVSKQDRASEKSLRRLMLRLYLTQPDGTVTSAQMDRKQARERFWHGSATTFDNAVKEASAARLLREEAATGSDETEEATIRLGHDTLCKVAGRWDAAEQAKQRIRKFQIGAMVAAAICGLMGLLYLRAENAKLEANYQKDQAIAEKTKALIAEEKAKVAQKNALKSADVAFKNQEKAEAEKKKADDARKEALAAAERAERFAARSERFAADSTLILAQNLLEQGLDSEARQKLFEISADHRSISWGLLKRLIDTRTYALTPNHTGPVKAVAWSPDGRIFASGSYDWTVKLWDGISGRLLVTLEGHTEGVRSVTFSPDGKTLASGAEDNSIRLWDVATGDPIGAPLVGHTFSVTSVSFSPDGKMLASGSDDRTIRLWDVRTRGAKGAPLTGHTRDVTSVAFSLDGKTLASGAWDNTIRLWDVATGLSKGPPLTGHTGEVHSVAFSPDRNTLASGAFDNTVRLWDVATGLSKGPPLTGHTNFVTSVTFSPDGKTLASGSVDNTIRLWDVMTGFSKGPPLTGHTNIVTSMAFSPDGKTLASGSDDHTIRFWDEATVEAYVSPLAGHTREVTSVAFSPDGKTLASGSFDKSIRLWDLATGLAKGSPLAGHTREVTSVAFSPDGKTLASGSWDNTIRLWDAATGTARGTPLVVHANGIFSVAFSPDGKTLASGSADNTILLWDVATGAARGTPLAGHTGTVSSVAFSPDGKTLASGSSDNAIRLWDLSTGVAKGSPLSGHTEIVTSIAFSPDGKTLASGSNDNTIRLWDVPTGLVKGLPLAGHTIWVSSVAFSPDGKTLASGSYDRTIRLWDVLTGTEVRKIALGQLIIDVAFSTAGGRSAGISRLAAAAGNDIRIWDCEFDSIDAQRIRDERIARSFLLRYPLFNDAVAALRRNETLTPEEKDRIAGIIQPLIDFQHARAAANAIPLPENVFQP